jgi:hypothetical protein
MPCLLTVHNRQGLTFKALGKSIADYDLWGLYLVRVTPGSRQQ